MNDKFTPERMSCNLVAFALHLGNCEKCGRDMVTKPKYSYDVFPRYILNTFDAQVKRANLAVRSSTKVDDEYICIDCVKAGKTDFKCDLCGKRKLTNKIKEGFGDPPDYLCIDCYETVSAKIWEEAVDELNNRHRYDYC